MNKTDQNIQNLLVESYKKQPVDSQIEDQIMETISTQKNYGLLLKKARQKAKIGLLVSLILLVIYFVKIYTDLTTPIRYKEPELRAFYPSIFTVIVVCAIYFEMIFGAKLLKK